MFNLFRKKENWESVHPLFGEKIHYKDKNYQQEWEAEGLTYQDAQEWIAVGFKPGNYCEVTQWKNHNFTSQKAKPWLEIGLTGWEDAKFATYLRYKNIHPSRDLNLEQLRKEFTTPQNYLDWKYPKNQRNTIKYLILSGEDLAGILDCSEFVNLEELNCSQHELISLKLDNCLKLKWIDCSHNQLTQLKLNSNELTKLFCSSNQLSNLELGNCKKLTVLRIEDNNFHQNLSFLSGLGNLKELDLRNNLFYGSLEYLKDLRELKTLSISDTDVDSGIEYLPESVEWFDCSAEYRKDAKCRNIYNLFVDKKREAETDYGYIKNLSQKLREILKKELQKKDAKNQKLKNQLNQKETENNHLKSQLTKMEELLGEQTPQIIHNPPK